MKWLDGDLQAIRREERVGMRRPPLPPLGGCAWKHPESNERASSDAGTASSGTIFSASAAVLRDSDDCPSPHIAAPLRARNTPKPESPVAPHQHVCTDDEAAP